MEDKDLVTLTEAVERGKRIHPYGYKRILYTDNLPKYENGNIKWTESIGSVLYFNYDNVEDSCKIIDYKSPKIKIDYNDSIYTFDIASIRNAPFAYMLGLIGGYRYNIGDNIITDNKNITILDRKSLSYNNGKNYKGYKYKCNMCGYVSENFVSETTLTKSKYCSACSGHSVLEGFNDIPTTAPWMIPYFQGGYDEAKLYTYNSHKEIIFKCPECNRIKTKKMDVSRLYKEHSIGCICSDGFSFPEKFIYNFLEQLDICFTNQLSKKTLKWCDRYRYDAYIKNKNMIIEINGLQHYNGGFSLIGKNLFEEQENDKQKENLAKLNGIEHYIILDCRKSELEWIKKSVLESELPALLGFKDEDIDWLECNLIANKSLVKVASDLWNSGKTTNKIKDLLNVSIKTVRNYLTKATELKLCNYTTIDSLNRYKTERGDRDE